VTGTGFSFAAAENVLAVGDTTVSADAYEIADDGSQNLIFTLPEDASEGETAVLLIVGGHMSNALPFTVVATP